MKFIFKSVGNAVDGKRAGELCGRKCSRPLEFFPLHPLNATECKIDSDANHFSRERNEEWLGVVTAISLFGGVCGGSALERMA